MISRTIATRLAAVAMLAAIAIPTVAQACDADETRDDSHAVSMMVPADRDGDANGIGTFHSNSINRRLFVVNGVVTGVNSTSVTVKRSNSDGTTTSFTFAVDTGTTVLRKFKGTTAIGEVSVGDRVQVWASSRTNGTAKLVWDKSIWRVALLGTISGINSTNQTYTLSVTRKDHATGLDMTFMVMVKATSSTTYWLGDQQKTFADLANGTKVYVRGTWDAVSQTLWAKKVGIVPTP